MAGLFRSLFKSKKSRKENKENTNEDDYIVFQPCPQSTLSRQRTARFADDCMLPATAAYYTKSAPKLKKGPQSCPGGSRGGISRRTSSRQTFDIDSGHDSQSSSVRHSRSQNSVYSDEDDVENNERVEMFERKSQYYMQKYEESERQRREERRKQERLEHERNSIQNAMSNMAYCMASVQQIEKLKSERDQYKKEMSRYRTKCEKLENKFEQLETMSPNYGQFQAFLNPMQPSPYQLPLNANRYDGWMSLAMTPIGSEGAAESLINPSDLSLIRVNGYCGGDEMIECARADRDEIERIDVEEPDDDIPPEDVWRPEWDEEDEVVAVLEAVVEHLEVNPWVRDFTVQYNYPETEREEDQATHYTSPK
ncbi:hypothetical protein CRE_11262 [Caenorhabditis remanei]|uniref:Uncharacterized protein n=1 Tax=Caenorhabditis remanei TaxID=31234 RepID=E3MQ87_CAERE|nr:hypothetical protein CRE_11262 [Caenorhabditis remanei]